MQPDGLNREAVLRAIAEHDKLGREEFLKRYGFKRGSRDYFLRHEGRNYDSKAIAAVAHKFMPGGKALAHSQLSGGVKHRVGAARELEKLGFEIATAGENADWSWDEHVLALHLYMTNRASIPGKTSPQVLELSSLLNRLGERTGVARTSKFRNANGVYMKLMNFRRLDPLVRAAGKSGLKQGNKLEEAVWQTFAEDPVSLERTATAIRWAIEDAAVSLTPETEDYEAEEGALVLRLHRSRERDRKLIEKRKQLANGKLVCEVCEFDFGKRYGEHGEGYIEVHHKKPVSLLKRGEKTKLSDLALVCSNCHRMLHRRKMLLGVEALRSKLLPV